jgi:hypothetical protein
MNFIVSLLIRVFVGFEDSKPAHYI